MKKLGKVAILLLVLLLIGFGCSKKKPSSSDDNIDNDLIGKWYLTSYVDEDGPYEMDGFVVFEENGDMNGEFNDDGTIFTYSGKFSVSGSVLITDIKQSSEELWLEPGVYKWDYSISGTLLDMMQIETDDPVHLKYSKENNDNPPTGDKGTLQGRVTSAGKGEPIQDVSVEILGTTFETATDSNGNYQITDIPVGTYTVKFTKTGYQIFTQNNVQITKDNTTTLNVTMSIETGGYGEVNGFVVNAADQDFLAGAYVKIEGTSFDATTDTTGYYEFTNVPVGSYTIKCSREGFDDQSMMIEVIANEEVNVDFIMIPSGASNYGSISGIVSNQDGVPIPNVVVQVVDYYNSSVTYDDGSYEIFAIPQGVYTLTFSKPGYDTLTIENVQVANGENTELNVTINQIQGTSNLICYVENVVGIPVNGALIEIVGTTISGTTGMAGACTIQNIPTGIYSVRVSKSGYQTQVIEHVEILAGIPKTLYITLQN